MFRLKRGCALGWNFFRIFFFCLGAFCGATTVASFQWLSSEKVLVMCSLLFYSRSLVIARCTREVITINTVTATRRTVVLAEAVHTWLWFKVLQVNLILVFSDVLMPPHHHNSKLELRTNTPTQMLLDSLQLWTCRTLNTLKYSDCISITMVCKIKY